MAKTVEDLIASGVEIPEDPVAIAKLLESSDAAAAAPAKDAEPDPSAPAKEPAADAATAAPEKDAAAATPPAEEATDTDVDEEGEKGPPRHLLRRYRETIHDRERELTEAEQKRVAAEQRAIDAERELASLKAKAETGKEALQERAEELVEGVDLSSLTPEKLAELRLHHDDELVNTVEQLAKAYETVQEQLDSVREANAQLEADREAGQRRQFLEDIDSVPLLGVLRLAPAEKVADERWARAEAYRQAVQADPDFAGKSRREIFAEVGRRMEGHLGKDVVKQMMGGKPASAAAAAPAKAGNGKQTPEQVIDEALAKARKSQVPTSLSEIPAAGNHVAQDETERLEAMSHLDLQDLMDKQLASGKTVDSLIAKLLSRVT